jgi:probable rRNA maturation factor
VSAAARSSKAFKSDPPVTVRRLATAGGLTSARMIRAVHQTLGDRPVAALNIAVVDDRRIARLHEEYLGDSRPTDVLTFDLRDDERSEAIEGEIVVSADTARREADRRGLDASEELIRYVIHGVLHLLGMDDKRPADRQRMRREETRILKLLRKNR